ncbi:phospholipase D-like domain-containing protein [Sulfurimonas sp. HSL1-2]|uniref:phospholipase D-like domain-containing protein n=1 Tax=Thiomicrolovo zhangzhouensis TaxID=3131933 RepID=UPI0031F88E57
MNFDWLQLLFFHTFVILGELMVIASLLHMIYQRRTPSSMMAWMLAIVLLPYLAVPLYFVLGSRKRRSRYLKTAFDMRETEAAVTQANPIDGILRNNGIPGATSGNRFTMLFEGTEAYSALLEQIRTARESIWLSTYVFKHDAVTAALAEALIAKRREGVEVKLLIDALGSWPLYFWQFPLGALRKAGVEVCFFMPILRMPFRNYINLRNHRKIYLFDRTTVLTGGMNLSGEYMGPLPDAKRWEDLLFRIEGPAAYHYAEIFAADWAYAAEAPPPVPGTPVHTDGDAYVQVVPSGPDVPGDALFEALLSAVYAARERIWIVTPYFVPDASLMQALTIANTKGVDVKLITPRESNHLLADLARSSYMRELEEAGIHVALYEGTMLHAKAILFDDLGAMLGSVNIDNRSLLLNYEVVSFAYSERIISETESWMEKLMKRSTVSIRPAGRFRRLGENLMRLIAPQL